MKKAQEHIQDLDELRRKEAYKRPDLANRYVSLIRRLSMKLRVRIPRPIKKGFCKHCYASFAPGGNCRVRTRKGMLVYYCYECKKYTKTGLGPQELVSPHTRLKA